MYGFFVSWNVIRRTWAYFGHNGPFYSLRTEIKQQKQLPDYFLITLCVITAFQRAFIQISWDNGRNFEGEVIKELCAIAKIDKSRTTPYHPMGNGMPERFNQTLLNMLGTLEEEQKSDWKSYVPTLVHAYNSTHHETTGYSPHYLMFGRHPRLAIDAFLGIKQDPGSPSKSSYVSNLKKKLDFAYKVATKEARRQSRRHKKIYDLKVRESKLMAGDRVRVRVIVRSLAPTVKRVS